MTMTQDTPLSVSPLDNMPSTKQIADSFVQFYYQNLHEDPGKLHATYTADAQLTHSTIPEEPGVNFISKNIEQHSFSTKKEIEAFYASSKLADSKIRVSSIDFQTFDKSILISVLGEFALKDEVAVYRFTQSFILKPARRNSYDIANDIFRLIPDEDYELNNTDDEQFEEKYSTNEEEEVAAAAAATEMHGCEKQQEKEPEESKTPEKEQEEEDKKKKQAEKEDHDEVDVVLEASKQEGEKKPANAPLEGPKEESTATPTLEEKDSAEAKPSKAEGPPKDIERKHEVATPTTSTDTVEKAAGKVKEIAEKEELGEEVEEEEKPVKDVAPGSWAQAASFSAGKPAAQLQKSKVTKPTIKKPQPSTELAQAPLSDVTNTQKPQPQGQKKKAPVVPELQFAVRVKNVDQLNADQIRRSFDKELGRVVRVEPRGHWALVAFETREAMEKALNKKTVKVEGFSVSMETKPSDITFSVNKRKLGPANNGSGKAPITKDKQQQQKVQNRRKK